LSLLPCHVKVISKLLDQQVTLDKACPRPTDPTGAGGIFHCNDGHHQSEFKRVQGLKSETPSRIMKSLASPQLQLLVSLAVCIRLTCAATVYFFRDSRHGRALTIDFWFLREDRPSMFVQPKVEISVGDQLTDKVSKALSDNISNWQLCLEASYHEPRQVGIGGDHHCEYLTRGTSPYLFSCDDEPFTSPSRDAWMGITGSDQMMQVLSLMI
jgi:hypothetical protein